MNQSGYSDAINHAFAFAAKHHDRQVRKGTKLPYLTQPANVAVILTRYECDEDTVVAGILHDVVQDCVQGWIYARDAGAAHRREIRRGCARHRAGSYAAPTSMTTAWSCPRKKKRATTSSGWLLQPSPRCGCARRTRCTTRTRSCPISEEPSTRIPSGRDSAAAGPVRSNGIGMFSIVLTRSDSTRRLSMSCAPP